MITIIKDSLAIVGAITLGLVASLFAYTIYIAVRNNIKIAKWQYKYKHRFDKPPIAACYCKDCKQYNNETLKCYKFPELRAADNWFCGDAYPLESDPDVPK